MGRDERLYSNCRERASQVGEPLYNSAIGAARLLGDYLASDWAARQNAYDSAAFRGTAQCARDGRPIHRFGDFPHPTRIDGHIANELVSAICHLDWASLGLTPPQCAARVASFADRPLLEQGQPAEPCSRGSSTLGFFSTGDEGHDDKGAPSAADLADASFTGRRTTESELTFMDSLGLEELQKVKIRLALWEVHPSDWYPTFRSILRNNYHAVYRLLGVFVEGSA